MPGMKNRDSVTQLRPKRSCPICGKPSEQKTNPFCSQRCRDRDLNRWLSGSYAIPVVEEDGAENTEGEGND